LAISSRPFWTYILLVIGIRENQEMTTKRAILVVIVPLALTLIFSALMIVLIGSFAQAHPFAALRG